MSMCYCGLTAEYAVGSEEICSGCLSELGSNNGFVSIPNCRFEEIYQCDMGRQDRCKGCSTYTKPRRLSGGV